MGGGGTANSAAPRRRCRRATSGGNAKDEHSERSCDHQSAETLCISRARHGRIADRIPRKTGEQEAAPPAKTEGRRRCGRYRCSTAAGNICRSRRKGSARNAYHSEGGARANCRPRPAAEPIHQRPAEIAEAHQPTARAGRRRQTGCRRNLAGGAIDQPDQQETR